ncbi:MAG: DNA alkylation repair protein [Candidatus Cloacimonetes bacterium]|jgi:3-methyladenine DNA glycosylase AlkD|nr:DNA alkylation repair protein [Candidatus Cloacimonadota bacterium]NLO44277.1 DNA alkylation repair protein [Candidatus Cloacimonadota bacterium]
MKSREKQLIAELKHFSAPEKIEKAKRYFKTGKGDYAEFDIFWGITTPEIKAVIQDFTFSLSLEEIENILSSQIHEVRMAALSMLVNRYQKRADERKTIANIYLNNTKHINNWDLVDISAAKILGAHSFPGDSATLLRLSKSSDLWEQRIAIVSTHHFIQNNSFEITFRICKSFLNNSHDLIHKACGWMLREIGKRSQKELINWLDIHYKDMPRTMLRYSIERFDENTRLSYLNGQIKNI